MKTTTSTKDVLSNHLQAFGRHDLNGVLADYAPDAVFFTQNGVLRGVETIKPLFQSLIAEFRKPGATFNLKEMIVDGDNGYIFWTAETADNVYELGTDTFVVRGGKIVTQSYTSKIKPKTETLALCV